MVTATRVAGEEEGNRDGCKSKSNGDNAADDKDGYNDNINRNGWDSTFPLNHPLPHANCSSGICKQQ
jgi:hypothetical protein